MFVQRDPCNIEYLSLLSASNFTAFMLETDSYYGGCFDSNFLETY